jgi:hypothetical protein
MRVGRYRRAPRRPADIAGSRSRPTGGHVSSSARLRVCAPPLLRPTLQAVPQPALHLAYLGRPARRLPALVNYHKLDRSALEKLTYTYLGAWITRQRDERDAGVAAADGRLVAALELQKRINDRHTTRAEKLAARKENQA